MPPTQPCGYAVDVMRAGYEANVRFFEDSPLTTRIRWYKVPDDRPFIPSGTIFASYNWDDGPMPGSEGVTRGTVFQGEQMDNFRPWRNGAEPPAAPTAQHLCGTAEQWLGRMRLEDAVASANNPMGWPRCCQPGVDDRLKLWLSAKDLIVTPPGPLQFWPGRSLVANDATRTIPDGIVSATGIVPGLSHSVTFGGGGQLSLTRTVGAGSWCVYAVMRWSGPGGGRIAMPLGGTNTIPLTTMHARHDALAPVPLLFSIWVNGVLRSVEAADQPAIVMASYDPVTSTLHMQSFGPNGDSVDHVVALPAPGFSTVGGPVGLTFTGFAVLAEVQFYEGLLTPDERLAVQQRLSLEWSIPLA